MAFESAMAIYTFQSRLKLDGVTVFHLPFTSMLYIVCHRQSANGSQDNGDFSKLKKLCDTLVGVTLPWLAILNDVANMDSWLLSKNSTHQTIRAHTEKEFLRKIASNRHIVARIV